MSYVDTNPGGGATPYDAGAVRFDAESGEHSEIDLRQVEVDRLLTSAERYLKAFHADVPSREVLREQLRVLPVGMENERARELFQQDGEPFTPQVVLWVDPKVAMEEVRGARVWLRKDSSLNAPERHAVSMTLRVGAYETAIVKLPDIYPGRYGGVLMDMDSASDVSKKAMPGQHRVPWGQDGQQESVLFVLLRDYEDELFVDEGFFQMQPGFENEIVRDGRLVAPEGTTGRDGQEDSERWDPRSNFTADGDHSQVFLAEKERLRQEIADRGIDLGELERKYRRGLIEPKEYIRLRREGVQQAFAAGEILDAAEAQQYFDRRDLTQAQLESVIAREAENRAALLQKAEEIRAAREVAEREERVAEGAQLLRAVYESRAAQGGQVERYGAVYEGDAGMEGLEFVPASQVVSELLEAEEAAVEAIRVKATEGALDAAHARLMQEDPVEIPDRRVVFVKPEQRISEEVKPAERWKKPWQGQPVRKLKKSELGTLGKKGNKGKGK